MPGAKRGGATGRSAACSEAQASVAKVPPAQAGQREPSPFRAGEGHGSANKLASGSGDPDHPPWSADGKKIVYGLYQGGGACSIWVMIADGSGPTAVTDSRTCDSDPAWQPRLP